ncbi:hypothetical protein RF11_07235 [Thelohanellus kitauei]|uniref:E3 ubiquitin-protein ligase n=1 Tax=Thelohanellus kitauei TaxID=669202 RepID=A0A0C2MU07_THEKT|nr:hypothetical protein RF11_07235 [Thelohanellus kitauei]
MDQQSNISVLKEPTMEEINTRIDIIIRRALLLTSEEPESDPQKIYSEVRLFDLVIPPIITMTYENVDLNTRNLFDSDVGALGRCTRILEPQAKAYVCIDCASDASNSLCEECLKNSSHVKHNYVEVIRKLQWLCHCGNSEAYGNSRPCCEHEVPEKSRNLPAFFVKRIRDVIRHLFRYLELLCSEESDLDGHMENYLLLSENFSELNLKDIRPEMNHSCENKLTDSKAQSACLLIFKPEGEDPNNVYSCVNFANPPGCMANLLSDFDIHGYICVKYRDTTQNCQASLVKIQHFIKCRLHGSRMYCKIVKVHRLFFMKLSTTIIAFIYTWCLSKSILCDHMSEMIFKETSLPEKFFYKRGLWKGIRGFITNKIFLSTLFSRKRSLNLVRFYCQNFERLHNEVLVGSGFKNYFFSLSMQIVMFKRQFKYLVINGILGKILDLISRNLKSLGLGKSESISKVLAKLRVGEMDLIFQTLVHFYEMLQSPAFSIDDSGQVKSELQKTTIRLIQFLFDFDDMEPLTLNEINHYGIGPNKVLLLIKHLHNIFVPYVFMILKFDDVGNKIIREFVEAFRKEMEKITQKLSRQEAIERLLTHANIEKKPFSILNLSQRLFWDILTECVVRRKLSEELKKTIFEDEALLLWISQAAITSLSLEIKYKCGYLIDRSNFLSSLVSEYHHPIVVHHLFLQDFNAIQFLISFICPEHFLKYLLFNICPSIREKTSIFNSISSILSLTEFDDTLVLQQVFILIYNALSEMRLVGDLVDPDSYFIERQRKHIQGHECRPDNINLRNIMQSDRGSLKSLNPYSNLSKFDTNLLNISSTSVKPPKEKNETIFTKYSNPGSPFYYLNTVEETEYIFKTLVSNYQSRVPSFLLPDVTGLREEFQGLDHFMFSKIFLEFIIECFLKWYKNSDLWKNDSHDLFLLILLCMCLILRVAKDRTISDSHRENMFDFFEAHQKLENRSLFDIIKNERPNSRHPLVASMIDRFISLSHIGQRNPTKN